MKTRIKTIMCATDFSDFSNYAVMYGVALAKEFQAKLYVCHVIDLPPAAIYGEALLDPSGLQHRVTDFALGELEQLLGKQPVDWEPLITMGNPAEEVARLADEKDVNMVVTATRSRTGLKRLILGSVTERLMQIVSCPLMVVHNPGQGAAVSIDPKIELKRIMVGCDFSSDSKLAFQYALELAQEFEAELHLVHVIAPPVFEDLLKPSETPEAEFQEDMRKMLSERIKSMVPEEAHYWCHPTPVLLAGQPHEELTKYAVVNKMDLIVLGVRGRGLVETLLVGSTTDRVVRRATCPVLAVSPTAQHDE